MGGSHTPSASPHSSVKTGASSTAVDFAVAAASAASTMTRHDVVMAWRTPTHTHTHTHTLREPALTHCLEQRGMWITTYTSCV
jgi:hypothetical protein